VSNFIKAYIIDHPLAGVIEIDEAAITSRRLGLIGRIPNGLLWVFGLYSRNDEIGYVFLMPNRRTQTLMTLIDRFVQNNSEIISDEFSTYVTNREDSRILIVAPQKSPTFLGQPFQFMGQPIWNFPSHK